MKRLLSSSARKFIILSLMLTLVTPLQARADETRDFVMSCTYGVLAGTLVGAASLSFTEKPGDKLYRIARGASLGLYAGILLGWYVTTLDDVDPEEEYGVLMKQPDLQVYPLISDNGVEGGAFQYSVLRF